jgi:hypothetical protein
MVPLNRVKKSPRGAVLLPQLVAFFRAHPRTMEGVSWPKAIPPSLALSPQATRALRSCSIPTGDGIVSATRTSACHGCVTNCRCAAHLPFERATSRPCLASRMGSGNGRNRPPLFSLSCRQVPHEQFAPHLFLLLPWAPKVGRRAGGATSAEQVLSLSSRSRRRPSRGCLQPHLRPPNGARPPRSPCQRPAVGTHLAYRQLAGARRTSILEALLGHGCDATMAPRAAFEFGGGSPGSILLRRRQFWCAAALLTPFSTPDPP